MLHARAGGSALLTPARFFGALILLAQPVTASAHGFGRLYNLPVPFWLYGWGAASALILSFLLAAYFASAPSETLQSGRTRNINTSRFAQGLRALLPALRVLGVLLLLLCMATGFWGNRDPFRNFSMTFFWVVFVLGFAYLSALLGDFYAALNPWRTLGDGLDRLWRGYTRGRLRYPAALGDWPALMLYLGFIWLELFGHGKPHSLAIALGAYTLLNLVGIGLVGSAAWFRHCEFFSLFLRLIALLSPFDYQRGVGLYVRAPLSGILRERPRTLASVVFALAMLSTTAFDGLRATQWWVFLYWSDPSGWVRDFLGDLPVHVYADALSWYRRWETLCLLLSPLLYFAIYAVFIALGKRLARSQRPLRELLLDFGYTLLPIALVYGMTHYATLLLTQGLKIVSLASDPFGWGWDLFGTAMLWRAPILPPMGWVWHTQVALILLGHVISVYLAHRVALRVFETRRQALLSQLPQLVLMVLFTVSGLWILAQPLTAERMM